MQDYTSDLGYDTESRFADIRASRENRRAQRDEEGVADAFGEPEAPKGGFARVLLTQLIVCALLLGGAFLCGKLAPHTFAQLRTSYTRVMRTDMSAKEVWAAIQSLARNMKEDIYVISPSVSEPSSGSAVEDSPAATVPDGAFGGKDIEPIAAEKNCSMAPLKTTVPPYRPIADGRLTSGFGLRVHPITGAESFHTGLDIGADEGDPISAAFYGTVIAADKDEDYGNYIILEHRGGLRTLYAHCSELLVEPGMVIRAGETIALVGSTGNSNGPHLHFEVRLHGIRYDPLPLFGDHGYQAR
ncbi:MAG: M23 family metallopeptidase [Oscillospiraceae bacterium]|nr:M23 family metallopeptidase [Oscillospiraceae bacterium]